LAGRIEWLRSTVMEKEQVAKLDRIEKTDAEWRAD
jgi:hypothetical protein